MHIRIVIVDDYDAIRENIKSFLSAWSDIEVVGEAKDGEAAVEIVKKLSPDVVLMDIHLPRLNGIAATRSIRKSHPQTRVIIVSAYDDKDYVVAGLRAGISGYVIKSSISDDLVRALHAAMANEHFLSPQIVEASIPDHLR